MSFLDEKLILDLRDKINESPIFSEDSSLNASYDLICAVLDRLDSSVDYLNKHSEYPSTEHDFLVFMMYSSIIRDASKQLCDGLEIAYPFLDEKNSDNYKFFKSYCINSPLNLDESVIPTDDRFFEYFRSIAFAHPFETSRAKFLKKNDKEIHYSPFVLVNNRAFSSFESIEDAIGVRVYTNRAEGWASILDIKISFSVLKSFIVSRYNFIQEVIKWAQIQIDSFNKVWRIRKVDRSLTDIEILEDIIEILRSRYQTTYEIESILEYLKCENSLVENSHSVEKFRSVIIKYIPEICDAVDELKYNSISDIIYSNIEVTPKDNIDSMTGYQLEKIFSYLNEEEGMENVSWGLQMVKEFSQGFSKEYVIINPQSMSFSEIKLLVRTACYLNVVNYKK